MSRPKKMSISVMVAALALSLATLGMATIGPAAAAPSAMKISKKTIKKLAKRIARKEINKAESGLSVADSKKLGGKSEGDLSVADSQKLGGKSPAQISPVLAGAQNGGTVTDIGGGTDVVTVNYTLNANSRVNFSAVVELRGDGSTADEASCLIRNDGANLSLPYDTTFDDIGTANPVSHVVLTSAASVGAGNHTAVLRCTTAVGGPISKQAAAINLVAVPN